MLVAAKVAVTTRLYASLCSQGAVVAGNRGFLAMGDWLRSYDQELITLFKPPKNRLPSYSTKRPRFVDPRLSKLLRL
jgi:hypothetical protein